MQRVVMHAAVLQPVLQPMQHAVMHAAVLQSVLQPMHQVVMHAATLQSMQRAATCAAAHAMRCMRCCVLQLHTAHMCGVGTYGAA